MSLDNLQAWADFLRTAGGHGWLAAGGVIAVILTAWLVWACWRLSNLPARPRPHQAARHQRLDLAEMADPSYNPHLDRHEAAMKDVLTAETDRMVDRYHRLHEERDR